MTDTQRDAAKWLAKEILETIKFESDNYNAWVGIGIVTNMTEALGDLAGPSTKSSELLPIVRDVYEELGAKP